jgi:endonuclease/exonuclease/phosphatase family metal-dependent hydrolase
VGAGDLPGLVATLRRGDLTNGRKPDAVVLLLQEVLRRSPQIPLTMESGAPIPRAIRPRTGTAADVMVWARRLDMHAAYVPSMRNGRGLEDRGNAILSTLPLIDVEAIELPFTRRRRVAVAASVEVPGQRSGATRQVRVVTAHFDTGLALLACGPARLRARSAQVLLSALATVPGVVVVGGDLNTSWGDDEPAVHVLRRHLPDARRLDRDETWHGPVGTRGRLDHLFGRADGAIIPVTRVSDRFGSDHHPVVGWFEAGDVRR